jgi:hypothetical protein
VDDLIDVDDPASWPPLVRAWAAEQADRLRGSANFTEDLRFFPDRDEEFRARLAGRKLRVYHATRLLDHEVSWIREHGLRPLTRELVEERIEAAHQHGYLTAAERERLLAENVFALGYAQDREGLVNLVIGRRGYDDDPTDVTPLLSAWGGEGIYRAAEGLEEYLARLGRPAIVAAAVDLSGSFPEAPTSPSLPNLFVGRLLELPHCWAVLQIRRSVPTQDVLAIWQPGHPEYDRHRELPPT